MFIVYQSDNILFANFVNFMNRYCTWTILTMKWNSLIGKVENYIVFLKSYPFILKIYLVCSINITYVLSQLSAMLEVSGLKELSSKLLCPIFFSFRLYVFRVNLESWTKKPLDYTTSKKAGFMLHLGPGPSNIPDNFLSLPLLFSTLSSHAYNI